MGTQTIDKLRDDIKSDVEQLRSLSAADDFDAEGDEAKTLTRAIESKQNRLKLALDADRYAADLAQLEGSLVETAKKRDDAAHVRSHAGGSLGDMFVRSRQFQSYSGYGMSGKVETGRTAEQLLKRAVSLPVKTTDLASFVPGIGDLLPQPSFQSPLLDLIPTLTTGMTSFPVRGLKVSEGGAAVVAEGDEKPPLDLVEEKVDVALEMVAVYTQVTRQVLALSDSAYIRDEIDTELRRAVLKKLEELAVAALTGATLPTAQVPSGGTMIGAIRTGIATVQTAGYTPNAVVFNPADGAAVEVSMLNMNGACCTSPYWGLQPVPVPGLTAGTVVVGDFTSGMRSYAHTSGLSLFMSDSHADTFTHNVLTILCEQLRKTVVTREPAFAKVSVAGP